MNNFSFQNTTKIIFGKGAEESVGMEVRRYTEKVLLHYGGGSIIKSGLYARVLSSLKESGVAVVELGGVMPNPRLSLVNEGIKICRDNNIDFILAVGGGSVIDSAKAIAVGVPYEGDVWDFYDGKGIPEKSLSVATVLTIPAAGSESSPSSVISDDVKKLKRGLTCEILRPVFSIMNPELTYTLPDYQTACGAADIMAHIMERYFTNTADVELTDRLCEAAMKTIIHNVPKVLKNNSDYASRAEVMWTGCVAHNDLLGTGRDGDWGSHMIEHEISAIYDVAHGAGLAVIFPAWMKYVYRHDVGRFVQFASRVFNVDTDYANPENTALDGIMNLEKFFMSIGLPVRLSEMGIDGSRITEMSEKSTQKDKFTVGNFVKLKTSDVEEIYKIAL